MAGPSGATLQSTKRGSRYWALRSQVQTAIAAASGRSDSAVHPAGEPHEAVGILEVGFWTIQRSLNSTYSPLSMPLNLGRPQ